MNNWGEIRKLAIVESDDFMNQANRNGLDYLFYWKAKFPKFKITLFTVPDKTTLEFLNLIGFPNNWVELAVHGFTHETNFECWDWDEITTNILLERIERIGKYTKIWKSPGWTITGDANGTGSGYKLLPPRALAKDNQAIYKALAKREYIIFDRHYNANLRPEGLKIVCVDDQPDLIHTHTWSMDTTDPNGRNGFQQVEEEHGVPWDQETEFYFVSEAWKKGLFKSCTE